MEKTIDCCKNCESKVIDDYCSKCGQSTKTSKIDLHYLFHEIQHSILHVDKGIFYTIKELLLRPGHTIREYLNGKRINHFKPFAFVLMLGTIYGFTAHFFEVYPESHLLISTDGNSDISEEYNKMALDWLYSHYSLSMLCAVPFFALSSFLVFRRNGYNYVENLIIYSYISGIQIFISLILYLIYYAFPSASIFSVIFIITILYNIWVLTQVFKAASWSRTIIKAFLSIVLAMIFISLVSAIIFTIVLISKL